MRADAMARGGDSPTRRGGKGGKAAGLPVKKEEPKHVKSDGLKGMHTTECSSQVFF